MSPFADHSCQRHAFGGFSTKNQAQWSSADVFDNGPARRDGQFAVSYPRTPRSPNGAFFRESLPYPLPPTAAIRERWGVRDAATFSRTFKRIAGPPPSEFRRRLASR